MQTGARATDNTSLNGRQLQSKIIGFARRRVEARRRNAARRRARRNQQLLDAMYKREDEKNT